MPSIPQNPESGHNTRTDSHGRRIIGIDDVTHWAVGHGRIGHVLMRQDKDGSYYTACGSWGPSFEVLTQRPRRICRQCRQVVSDRRVVESAERQVIFRRIENAASFLRSLGACGAAVRWAADHGCLLGKAWESCERGDWLLWLTARVGVDRKLLVTAACRCAREVLHFVPQAEDRPRKAIETAEAWVRGEASAEEVRSTAAAAANAGAMAIAIAAPAAAYSAAYAGAIAIAAPNAEVAATATDAIAEAAAAKVAAKVATKKKALRRCAEIVRETITWRDVKKCLAGQLLF